NVQYANSAFTERHVAFELEAIPWIDDVYRFALSLTRDESDADDVVEDTFLRACRSLPTYLPGRDCRVCVVKICTNVFQHSRERCDPPVELDSSDFLSVAADSVY